ncbi:MAG: hypothetical protein IIB54_15350, partial [Planctomycetes bacterium]|nr:hypothetical protein [Planctomycetota bacterium]
MKRTIGAAFICLLMLISPAQGQMGPLTWHVSEHVSGGDGSGFDWPNAMPSLTAALAMAQGGDTIRVGQGTYHPDPGQSFVINFDLNQIKLIGGHAGWLPNGTLAPDPFQRDVQNFQTILSGDLENPVDDPFVNDLDYLRNAKLIDNADIVVMVQDVLRGTRIEGFFIERGAMNSPTGTLRGGGMYIVDSAMDVVNCTFRYNTAGIPFQIPEIPGETDPGTTSDGGGAAVLGGQMISEGVYDYTRFINCTFHDNIAGRGGALALVDGSLEVAKVKMINCRFYDNRVIEISTAVLKPDYD